MNLNVTFPGNLAQVDTASVLRSVPSASVFTGILFIVKALQGVFVYDSSSTAADDGATVLKPTDKTALQAGRWLKDFDGLAPGPPGGSVTDVGPFSTISAQTIADTNLIQTSGSTRGQLIADTSLTDADVAAHPLAIVKTANGRYFRRDPRNLWVEQFGATGAGKPTNDRPAFVAALKYAAAFGQTGSSLVGAWTIRVGVGTFYWASRINNKATVKLLGQGSGLELGTEATIIQCDDFGWWNERADTLNGAIASPVTTFGDGSEISGIQFTYTGSDTTKHRDGASAINSRSRINVNNCAFYNFPGPGVQVVATSQNPVTNPYIQGEASGSVIRKNVSEYNWCGIFIDGDDSNVHEISTNTCGYNKTFGIVSTQTLCCTFFNNHLKSNGQLIYYAGKLYQGMPGQEASWAGTTPGTNPSVWSYVQDGSVGAAFSTWPSLTGFVGGGAVWHNGRNARSVFMANYFEQGQGYPVIMFPAVSIGGQWGHAQGADGVHFSGEQGTAGMRSLTVGMPFTPAQTAVVDPSGGFYVTSASAPSGFGFGPTGTNFQFTYGRSGSFASMYVTGPNTEQMFGRSSVVPNVAWFPTGYVMGQRKWETGSAAPTTGNHAQGEVVWNDSPAPGGNVGWVCTTAGTPGTWKTFGAVAA